MHSKRVVLTLGTLSATIFASLPGVSAAAADTLPQATKRVEAVLTDPTIPTDVQESYVQLYYPLAGPAHPAACDWTGYIRLRPKTGPTDSKDAKAVVVNMPGLGGGAALEVPHSAQVVNKAAAKGKKIEYWVLERRSNCLEDHTGLDEAHKARDAKVALDYYSGKTVNSHTFGGWPSNDKLGIVADFGLARTVDDWRVAIQQALPDAADHKKVFCGGHSLGGLITGAMLTWDFDGNPQTQDDAGYNLCGGGNFALDTFDTIDPAGVRLVPILKDIVGMVGGGTMDTVNAALKSGAAPRTIVGPSLYSTIDAFAIEAQYKGDQESHLLKELPADPIFDVITRFTLAKDYAQFLSGVPNPRDFRFTGEALLGTLMDNNTQSLGIVKVGAGTLDGGPVAQKTFPIPGEITSIPLLGEVLNDTAGFGPTMTPTSTKTLYHWRNYDHVGDADAPKQLDNEGKPFSTPDKEVSDIHDLAYVLSNPGPVDSIEWYFPTRLLTDFVFAVSGTRSGDLSHLIYKDGPTKHETVSALASDGPVQYFGLIGWVPKENRTIAPGYHHIDMATAAAKQNNGKPEIVSTAITDFILRKI